MRPFALLSCALVAFALACVSAEPPSAPTAQSQATDTLPTPKAPPANPVVPSDARIVESFDLETIGGVALPLSYSGGGSTWQIVGGRYDLRADGLYSFYYLGLPERVPSETPTGWYIRTGRTIEFYTSGPVGPFYLERNRHFSTGVLTEHGLIVDYEDYIDFEREVYRRR